MAHPAAGTHAPSNSYNAHGALRGNLDAGPLPGPAGIPQGSHRRRTGYVYL